ncbi:Serine/threonine-protein phosphatase 4 regulatory subunit 1 [Linnemannia zychae]|nr:Serine/threonine-protein phosphatase 4 regulatory subunit 1 [Linnemannia zychae]
MSTDQDDTFDPVDTENLLAQMSSGSLMSSGMVLDEDTDMVQLFAEPNLTSVEKARLLSQSEYEYHRSFLARELPPLLHQMNTRQAIIHVIPIIRNFSLDPMDTVRESLASQLDKIVLHFYQNSIIDHTIKETPTALDEFNHLSGNIQGGGDNEGDSSQHDQEPSPPPPLPHDIFTPVFLNLLLDQNADIAHQTRLAIVSVAENIPDNVMESEILHGIISGLERLYSPDIYGGLDSGFFGSHRDEQDGEAELGKMLVVVLLTALATLLGPERCTTIVIPTLERFIGNSQFYVRKEIVMALGALAKVVDQSVTVERLVPLYNTFVQDDTWHIRRACCTILASLLSALPVDMKASKAEEIYDIFSVDVSRSVRSSIMEVLGEVIAGFEIEQVPESLLNHFLAMGHNPLSDHERAVMCAFSFPAVILTAGRSKWDVMKPVYMKLAGTFRTPIRRSLACSLHEVAKVLGPELADRDLAVAFSDCLKAEDDVREGVLAHFIEFLACLSPKCRSDSLQHLYRAWIDLERSSQWRTRDTLAGQLPGLCEIVDGRDILQIVMPLCVKVCTDSVAVVRESGVKSFAAFWEVSDRFGLIPIPSDTDGKSDGLDFPTMDEDEEEQQHRRESQSPELLFQQHDEDDVEMEDVTEDFEKISQAAAVIAAEQEAESKEEQGKKGHQEAAEPAMTTVKEQVIYQTTDFAVNGGFRSRVVAVQIIQSLLERGISILEFEEHFLPILTDRLGVDSVANVRISVAKIVSWIVDGSYYGDQAVSPRIQELHVALQQDPDRDVRAYSGGPAELPKAKKSKKKALKNKKATRTVTVFHQNPKNGELGVMQREENEDGTEVQVLFEGEDLLSDDNDEEEDEDEDSDEDDSSDEEFKIGTYSLPLTLVGSRSSKTFDSWGDLVDGEMESTAEANNDSLIISESPDGSDEETDAVDGVVPSVVSHVNGTRPLDIEAGEPLDASSDSDESEPDLDLDSHEDSIDSSDNSSVENDAAFPPLSTSPIANSSATSTTPLSYADLVKSSDDTRTRAAAAAALASNVSSLTSFCQANIPEPPSPSTTKNEAVLPSGHGLSSFKSSPSKSGAKLQLSAAASSNKEPNFAVPLSPLFPSLSSSSSSPSSSSGVASANYSTSSASSSASSSSSSAAVAAAAAAAAAAASLPFSYASVVASGAAAAAAAAAAATSSRAFSPPLSPPMTETTIALTF